MDYITAEQFLEQSKKIRKALFDWWKPQMGDLYCDKDAYGADNISCVLNADEIEIIALNKVYKYYIPLLSETNLRHFIEDKTGCKIDVTYTGKTIQKEWIYQITCFEFKNNDWLFNANLIFRPKAIDLLQAYWQVACKIAVK